MNPGVDVITNFSVVQLHFAEMKPSDWSKLVIWLATSNHSALFQHGIVMPPILKFIDDIGSSFNEFFYKSLL